MSIGIFLLIVTSAVALMFLLANHLPWAKDEKQQAGRARSHPAARHAEPAITAPLRGTPGEREVIQALLQHGFKPTAIYHDLLVRRSNGHTAQIDIVVATNVGLIVVEVKDMNGWLFGNGLHDFWTVTTSFGHNRYRLYNPFKQNETHIAALREMSPVLAALPMHSLVVMAGCCELRNVRFIPHGCYLTTTYKVTEAVEHIVRHSASACYADRWEVARLLQGAVDYGGSKERQRQHIMDVRRRLGADRVFE